MGPMDELRKIGGSDALYHRVLDLFAARVPQAVETTEILSHGGGLKELADAAHALKSMCANIGARRAATACNDLELAARTGEVLDASAGMAAIIREVRRALAEINRLRAAA